MGFAELVDDILDVCSILVVVLLVLILLVGIMILIIQWIRGNYGQ